MCNISMALPTRRAVYPFTVPRASRGHAVLIGRSSRARTGEADINARGMTTGSQAEQARLAARAA